MITLLNGQTYGQDEINTLAIDDEFYYGELGKNAVGSSELRNIFGNPDRHLQNLTGSGSSSDALILGKLTHQCWLEPDKFYKNTYTELRANSNAYKELVAKHGEQNVFKDKWRGIAQWLCQRLDTNERIHEIRKGADVEVPMVKMLDGIPVRAKADLIKDNVIYDLKTTNVSPQQFEWKVDNDDYDLQAYIYMQLFPQCKEFKFICINKMNRALGLITVKPEHLERGKEKYEWAIRAFFMIYHNTPLDEIEFKLSQHIYEGESR